jgi:hypothetical protein
VPESFCPISNQEKHDENNNSQKDDTDDQAKKTMTFAMLVLEFPHMYFYEQTAAKSWVERVFGRDK